VADPKKISQGAEDNLSAPSSFIANALNLIHAFYTEKADFWKKYQRRGGAAAPTALWIGHCYDTI